MSVASQSLAEDVTYEDLYRRWEQGHWSAYAIDFSADRSGWRALSDIQRRSAMWMYSMFFHGEDRVADTLGPYIAAAPTEEQAYFLSTQQVDEVRHAIFFHRFFKDVIEVGGDSIEETLASTLPELNWGYRGVFNRLERMAEELRTDRSKPKYAQAITLYHLIVEGTLAQPGQHFIEDYFAAEKTLPGFSAGMTNVSRDEQRHIAFGVKVLSELMSDSDECKAAVTELLREVLPYSSAVFMPPDRDRAYTECYGFSVEDIYAFGLKLTRQRWRTIGYPVEEMPADVFPFDRQKPLEEVAARRVKMMMAGLAGGADGAVGDSADLPPLERPDAATGEQAEIARHLGTVIVEELLDIPYSGDDPLADGAVDSLGQEQLVDYIAEKYDVTLDDEDFVRENFQSLAALASLVIARR